MMVVPVLMTNCHVSLKLNNGPVMIQTRMMPTAMVNTGGLPVKREVAFANLEYHDLVFIMWCALVRGLKLVKAECAYIPA